MSEKSRVTFKINSVKRAIQFDSPTNNHEQPELVTGLDNGEIISKTPPLINNELIIPVQPNTHRKFFKLETNRRQTALSDTTLSSNERHENGLMNTSASVTEEEEDNHIEDADYNQVSIDEFGMAVLNGMGYEKDSGLGKSNKRKIDVFVPETRPRGLGLGADRKTLEKLNQLKHNLKKSGINENDDLYLEKGAFVLIQQGSYHNSYGTIDSIDEDLGRLNIILAMNDTHKTISVSQYNVKLVTEKEFLKYSRYVNKKKFNKLYSIVNDYRR